MSKLPILDTSSASLARPVGSVDGSERAVLRIRVNSTVVGMLDFFGSHISFDRNPQLEHVKAVLQFVDSVLAPGVSQIILADWNTFPDWEEPMNLLLGTYTYEGARGNFTEAYQPLATWPTWGAENRCDRIFYRFAPDTPPSSSSGSEFPLTSVSSPSSSSSSLPSRSLQQMKVSNDGERRFAQNVVRFNATDSKW